MAGYGDYVVGLETVDDAAVLVLGVEHGHKFVVIKIGGEMSEFSVYD